MPTVSPKLPGWPVLVQGEQAFAVHVLVRGVPVLLGWLFAQERQAARMLVLHACQRARAGVPLQAELVRLLGRRLVLAAPANTVRHNGQNISKRLRVAP